MSETTKLDLIRASRCPRAPVVWTDGEHWAVTRDRVDDAVVRRLGWRHTIDREGQVPLLLSRRVSELPSGVYVMAGEQVAHVGSVAGLVEGRRA